MLHVLTGPGCNNNCLFCMEADRAGRDAFVRAQTARDVRAMIAAYPDRDQILFTSGEPTLNPELPRYAGWAREHGFRVVGLITNGRRLAYPAFLEQLLRAGINRITVSVHGPSQTLHDSLTRTPGSFDQTNAALQNLTRAKRQYPSLQVHTSTVLNGRNLPALAELSRFLGDGPADQIVFNVLMGKGRGALHAARLMPRYSEVVRAFAALFPTLAPSLLQRMRVVDLPPCVLASLPRPLGGALEAFEQFEPVGSTGLTEIAVFNECSSMDPNSQRAPHDRDGTQIAVEHLDPEWAQGHRPWWTPAWLARWTAAPPHLPAPGLQRLRQRITTPSGGCDQKYYVTQRSWKDEFLRAKGANCRNCVLEPSCPGVWKAYADLHGWSELVPIQPSAPPPTPATPV